MHTGAMLLLSFAARNHRSLRDWVELDLTRPSLTRLQPPGSEAWSEHVYRVVGVFGPNASGKSALIDAVAYMQAAVRSSGTTWQAEPEMPRAPFALDPACAQETSEYTLAFVFDDPDHGPTRFDYAFEVSSEGVESESLYALYATRRERVFERRTVDGAAKVSLPRGFEAAGALRAITRRELVMSRAILLDHPVIAPIGRALLNDLDVIRVGDANRERRLKGLIEALARQEIDFDGVATMLRIADIGIDAVTLREEEMPPQLRALRDEISALAHRRAEEITESSQARVVVVPPADAESIVRTLDFRHRGQPGVEGRPLHVSEESTGTVAWLALTASAVEMLRIGGVLVVDELDAALHPYLVDVLVGMFDDESVNRGGAQLLFTGHGTTVLSPLSSAHLSPEQVWLTEKRTDGVTELFSVADFPHRAGDNIEKRYLDGRYGAVPSPAPSLVHSVFASHGGV